MNVLFSYSKSAQSKCNQCSLRIDKGLVRIGLRFIEHRDIEDDDGDEQSAKRRRKDRHIAEAVKWFHFECITKTNYHFTSPMVSFSKDTFPPDHDTSINQMISYLKKEDVVIPTIDIIGVPKKDAKETITLTPEQKSALDDATVKFGLQNKMQLASTLRQHELPVTGSKKELVDRMAITTVLQLPAKCSLCDHQLHWIGGYLNKYQVMCKYVEMQGDRLNRCPGPKLIGNTSQLE